MRHPQLCATVTAATMADLLQRRDAIRGADLVELRLDGVVDLDVRAALAGRRLPVIATCRPVREGGRFEGPEETRVAILETAWAEGAEWVDVEDGAADALLASSGGRRVVRSHHDFAGMPADLETRLRRLVASGAEVAKIAVTATTLTDVVRLAETARRVGGRTVVIAMGEAGVTSRLLAGRLGSPWTYAGQAVAPGQLSLERMRDEFHAQRVSASTAVYGVLGRPIAHSLSPAMHNAAFDALGLDAVYVPLAAETFEDFERFARAFDLHGVSVTAPFKVDAYRASTVRDAQAEAIGAVNTLQRGAGGWESCNTDVAGFLAPLAGRDLAGRRVAILGAGGAARGVAAAVQTLGAHATIYARRPEAASAVASATGARAGAWPPPSASWDVLVNATPVGTGGGQAVPIDVTGALTGRLVYDLVYNPPQTALLARARALGADTIGGLSMLVAQAAAQCAWWTGRTPPVDAMRRAALQRLEAIGLEAMAGTS